MGFFSKLFGVDRETSAKEFYSLKSFGYKLSSEEEQEADKALISENWRDWETACSFLGELRIDSAIKDIKKLLWKKEAENIPNIAMFSLAAIFQIGGNKALKAFRDVANIPAEHSKRFWSLFFHPSDIAW